DGGAGVAGPPLTVVHQSRLEGEIEPCG
ncbi:MAG: hypothetical protein ACI9K2_007570, partial [Myxococcota bacterium]